jgi:hypothetical protein
MRSKPPRRGRVGLAVAILAFAIVGLLVNIPVPAQAASSSPAASAHPAGGRVYTVTWNGVDVSTASTFSSALSIDFTQSANLLFSWSVLPSGSGGQATINDARLQMFYFGFAVSTRDQVITPPNSNATGSIPLSWTPLSINYILEGTYRLTASFVAPNGTTIWSEDFYVHGSAPFGFVAVVPIVLLAIAAYEIYALVRSGRYAAMGRKSAGPPPSSPPSGGPSSTTPPTEAEAPASTPPAEGSSPPPGGSS